MRSPGEFLKRDGNVARPQMLVVDDDAKYLQLLGSIMAEERIEASYATSGEEALGLLKVHSFPVLITDLNMGGMNGYALAIMARELHPDIEVIMITGDLSSEVYLHAAAAGISQVLAKPCRVDDIRKVIAATSLSQHTEKLHQA